MIYPVKSIRKRLLMTIETMKTKIDYAQSSEILKTTLKLKGSPVAIGFANTKEDIPLGMTEFIRQSSTA